MSQLPKARGGGFANDRLLLDSDQVHRFVWPDLGAADGRSQSSLTTCAMAHRLTSMCSPYAT